RVQPGHFRADGLRLHSCGVRPVHRARTGVQDQTPAGGERRLPAGLLAVLAGLGLP
ncbi:unnamed protein product, partial [Heterosigma akashiwo]